MQAEARADLCEALNNRAEQVRMRAIMGACVAVVFAPILQGFSAAWFGLWISLQLAENLWVRRAVRAGTLERNAPWGLGFIAASNLVFGAIAFAGVLTGRPWTMILGAFVMSGALMNAGPSTGRSRLAFLASAMPICLYAFAGPVTAALQHAAPGEIWGVFCGSLLLLLASLSMRSYSVRALEAERRANEAKTQFLATMSHEIRTPLNGVLGMAQAMAAEPLPKTQRARLQTIGESGETLLALLNDVLDLSKVEAGKLELEDEAFELTPLARAVENAFSAVAGGKSLAFAVEVEPSAQGAYRGDGRRIRQVLFNLVSNALKFTDYGEVRVRIRRDGEMLTACIRDTGIGIPAHRLPQLFDKYTQAEASTERRFGGTGLGLAISRELATRMGGTIEVTSTEGLGSEFTLRLPLVRVADEAAVETAPALAAERQAPLKILAAEDNSVNQMVLRTLLQQMGVDPVIVVDGVEALEAWRAEPWDVILMDVQMPRMDGVAATKAIRAEELSSGRARTPIIALTANAMSHQAAEYLAAGMDVLVAKPIRVQELFEALQAIPPSQAAASAAA